MGFSSKFSIRGALKAAVGEHLERASQYVNAGRFQEDKTRAFNLGTGEVVLVPTERILLCLYSRILHNRVHVQYNDPCGTASYTASDRAINTAFLEFFERQPFTFNWLSKSGGRRIALSEITDRTVRRLDERARVLINEI